MRGTACIILAAGKGTRMQSDLPKVLHKIAGRSLLGHVLATAGALGTDRFCVVAGPGMENVARETTNFAPTAEIVTQHERLGTGHAVMMAKPALAHFTGKILILYGDVPLTSAETLAKLLGLLDGPVPLAVLGFEAENPTGYGRLLVGADGALREIREELDASDEEKAIKLCNSGIMAVEAKVLWSFLDQLDNSNANGEFYLTDIVEKAVAAGHKVNVSVCPESEVAGINDRVQLAQIEKVVQIRLRNAAMLSGVTLTMPETVFLSADTQIGRDVVIEPNVYIGPGVKIAQGATIKPFTTLENCNISENAVVGPNVSVTSD